MVIPSSVRLTVINHCKLRLRRDRVGSGESCEEGAQTRSKRAESKSDSNLGEEGSSMESRISLTFTIWNMDAFKASSHWPTLTRIYANF